MGGGRGRDDGGASRSAIRDPKGDSSLERARDREEFELANRGQAPDEFYLKKNYQQQHALPPRHHRPTLFGTQRHPILSCGDYSMRFVSEKKKD